MRQQGSVSDSDKVELSDFHNLSYRTKKEGLIMREIIGTLLWVVFCAFVLIGAIVLSGLALDL